MINENIFKAWNPETGKMVSLIYIDIYPDYRFYEVMVFNVRDDWKGISQERSHSLLAARCIFVELCKEHNVNPEYKFTPGDEKKILT